MAWINGEWVGGKKRDEIIEVYREYIELMDDRYTPIDDLEAEGLLDEY